MSTKIKVKALHYQRDYIMSDDTFPALVAGYGSGKTHALTYRLMRFLYSIPKAQIGIYEPTHDLIRQIIIPRLEEMFQALGLLYKLNKSEGIIDVWMPMGKARIIMRSMDNPSRLIGYEHHHALVDEIDVMPKDKAMDVWIRILARNRKRIRYNDGTFGKNTVGITTTPEGFGFVYNMWMKEHANDPDYRLIRGRTQDNFHLDPAYVQTLRATYPPQLLEAYLNGEFINLKGNTVYDGFDREQSNTDLTIDDFSPTATLHIGEDFNIGRSCAVVVMKGDDGKAYVVDEFFNLMDTPAMIKAIQARYSHRTIVVFPDASGRSRKSVDASKSDIRLLRDAGFRINAPKKNPPVRQRVLSTNTAFLNGEGERTLYVNTRKCPNLTEALEKQIYDDNGVPIKDGKEDINDGLGYCVDRLWGLAKPTATIGRMKMWG